MSDMSPNVRSIQAHEWARSGRIIRAVMAQFEESYRVGSASHYLDHLPCGNSIRLSPHAYLNLGVQFIACMDHANACDATAYDREDWAFDFRDGRTLDQLLCGKGEWIQQ